MSNNTPLTPDDPETEYCGEETSSGDPCKRPAGFGTESDTGPCMDHREEYCSPRKFNEARREQLLGAAETGAFQNHIAQFAGITEQTLRNWLKWGKEQEAADIDSDLAEFYLDFQRARGAGAVNRLDDVPPEFVLERSYGYTKTEEHSHEVSGPGGDPVATEHSHEHEHTVSFNAADKSEEAGDGLTDRQREQISSLGSNSGEEEVEVTPVITTGSADSDTKNDSA